MRCALQRADDYLRLFGGAREVAGVDGFADAGNRLDAVPGVQARRVNRVAEPRPIGQPRRLDEIALRHHQPLVHRRERRRARAAGEQAIRLLLRVGARACERLGGRLQPREVQRFASAADLADASFLDPS